MVKKIKGKRKKEKNDLFLKDSYNEDMRLKKRYNCSGKSETLENRVRIRYVKNKLGKKKIGFFNKTNNL